MKERENSPTGRDATYVACYERRTAPLRAHRGCVLWLRRANRALKWLFYGAYGLLLVLAAGQSLGRAAVLLLVTALGFAAVSAARARLNAPRPYEACDLEPLIERKGAGRSFPSRHTFSAFAVATSWFAVNAAAAWGLLAGAVAVACLRVVGGVHFPRDVVAGAVAGVVTGGLACGLSLLA